MLKYIVKRILLAVVTIWAVATLTFFLMNLVPGGPFLSEKAISPQAQAALEAKYGLDKPMSQRYVNYMTGALHGDFGDSLKQRGRTVMSIISMKFPVSARVGGISVLVALILGIPLGSIAALKRGKAADSVISVIATCGIAVPSFVICTLLMYFFGVKLGASAHDGSGECKALCDAGDCPVFLSYGLYYASDAFLHAGCARTGLHAHGAGKRTGGRKDTLQARA